MTGRRATLAVVMLLLLVQVSSVAAGTIVRRDGDDSPSPLDLSRVRVSHAATAHVFRVSTHEPFRDGRVDGTRGWIRVGFDPTDGVWRRSVYVYTVEGELRGVVTDEEGAFLRFVRARRLDGNRVEVRVPPRVFGPMPYRFAVWSVWRKAPCSPAEPCVDWVPDAGTIRHAGANG